MPIFQRTAIISGTYLCKAHKDAGHKFGEGFVQKTLGPSTTCRSRKGRCSSRP